MGLANTPERHTLDRIVDTIRCLARHYDHPLRYTNNHSTIGGMILLIIGGGPMFSPMAVAIAFGLLFSTAFNIFVIPNLYALFFKIHPKR